MGDAFSDAARDGRREETERAAVNAYCLALMEYLQESTQKSRRNALGKAVALMGGRDVDRRPCSKQLTLLKKGDETTWAALLSSDYVARHLRESVREQLQDYSPFRSMEWITLSERLGRTRSFAYALRHKDCKVVELPNGTFFLAVVRPLDTEPS